MEMLKIAVLIAKFIAEDCLLLVVSNFANYGTGIGFTPCQPNKCVPH